MTNLIIPSITFLTPLLTYFFNILSGPSLLQHGLNLQIFWTYCFQDTDHFVATIDRGPEERNSLQAEDEMMVFKDDLMALEDGQMVSKAGHMVRKDGRMVLEAGNQIPATEVQVS